MRCLAKQPDARYRDYASLERALLPFSSRAASPATLGMRFLASAIDMALMGLCIHMPLWVIGSTMDPSAWPMVVFGTTYLEMITAGLLVQLAYFSIPEGLWGTSPGKAICQMQIVDRNGSRIGLPRAVIRTFLFAAVTMGPSSAYLLADPTAAARMQSNPTAFDIIINYSYMIMVGLLFCRARRANGFSGLHDMLTNSRVVGKHALHRRSKVSQAEEQMLELKDAEMVGPYHALV